MNVRDVNIRNFDDAKAYLNDKWIRKLCNNTYMIDRLGFIEVTYHGHTIARFYKDYVIVSSCGYRTYTTKERINRLIPKRFVLSQTNFDWMVWNRDLDMRITFKDNVALYYDGH